MVPTDRQSGFILLPVVLTITLVATIAFLMNHESAIHLKILSNDFEVTQAEYLTQAGLNHALWQATQQGCGPYTDITNQPLGSGSYTTTLTTNLGSTTNYSIAVDQDSWIRSDQPTVNKATDSKLHIRYDGGTIERPMYRYGLSSLPVNATILSARAWFYVSKQHPEGPVDIHRLTADWAETDATWDTMGTEMGSAVLATIPTQPTAGVWVSVNLTAQVQIWVNGQPNYGLTLNSTSEGTHGDYASREASQQPYLEVVVGTPSSSPATLQSVGTLANGVSRSITRNDMMLYQQPPGIVELQPSTEGIDAEIWEQSPNDNYGDAAETWVSSDGNDTTRSLLHFNIGAIPAGARILGATLFLHRQSGSGADQPVAAHRIMNPWSEDSVTWNRRESGTNWDTAGGDFDNTVVVTTLVGPVNQRYEWNITPLVQGWVDGSYPNYGVALTAAIDGMLGEQFFTSDHTDPSKWPSLTITYTCQCDSVCLAPQGSGKVLMVIGNSPSNPSPGDQSIRDYLERLGYTVSLIQDDDSQGNFNAAVASNDVVYVSESVSANNVGTKLTGAAIGVVNTEGALNDELGISSGSTVPVGSSINITDTSHYITQPFAAGGLQIFAGAMEGLVVSGTEAGGLQTLADSGGAAALVALETGAALYGGGTASGRRVMLPIGREVADFNWDYVNNNGQLIVQRALQWGAGNDGSCTGGNFRDEFATAAFSNNDGSENWSGDWIEIDSAGTGPTSGKAVVTGGELRLNGTPLVFVNLATGAIFHDPSLTRELDLSSHLSATLTFDYRTGSGVEAAEDSAVVEISGDGGSTWTVLEDFIDAGPSAAGSRSYDITPYIASNTQVRFRINAAYGGPTEYFYVDNVDIAASCDPLVVPEPSLFLSTDSDAILGGLSFTDIDLVEYDPVTDTASLYFDGSLTTLTVDITALHVLANGHLVLAAEGSPTATLGGLSFEAGDLVDYDPATDTATLIFDGSTLFTDPLEKFKSVHVLDNGHFILSTDSDANLGGLSFTDIDLVEYDPVTDTASLYFDGSLTTLTVDITALHVLANGHLVLAAKGGPTATLGGLSFEAGDLVDYDPATDTATLIFDGSTLFTDPLEKFKSLHVGLGSGAVIGGGGGGGEGGRSPPPTGVVFEEFTEAKRSNSKKSLVIDKPGGTAAGDLLIAAITTDGKQEKTMTLDPSTGWTLINQGMQGEEVTFAVFWKIAEASEPASYDVNWKEDQEAYVWMMRFTGHDPGNPINVSSIARGSSSSPSSPAVATTVPNTMILRIGGFDDDDITVDAPGLVDHTAITMDKSSSGGGTCSGGTGYLTKADVGDSGTSSFSLTRSEEYRTVTIAIAPDTGG
ncbi:MAG: DNRLRE domain-containing protein [Gammaproteobacteria bacterium]|nr:DNRLRE domain-containing protein [Gammaproteobacteria bacterium]